MPMPISLTIFHFFLHSPLLNLHLVGFFCEAWCSAMDGVSVFRNIFIMFSLSRPNEETAPSALPQRQQSSMIIQQLQAEIKYLHRAIALKDQTLEEIRKLVNHSLSQKTAFSSFDIVNRGLEDAKINREESGIRRSISYEISAQIDESIEDSFSAAREEFNKILRYYDSAMEVVNAQYQAPKDSFPLMQTPIKIVQIPVEVVMWVQVPRQVIKYIEVPIAKVQEVEVYSIMPVQIETVVEKQVIHEVPVEIILVEDETEQGEMMLNSAIPEQTKQTIEEESLQVELEIQIDPQQLEIGEGVFEVQKIIEKVQVQKIVYVDRPIEIVKTVQRIVQVPVEVIVEKLIEVETIIQRNNETVIQTTKEVFVDNNIIFQIPVEVEVQHSSRENQHVHQIDNKEKKAILLHAGNEQIEESNHNQIQITDIEVVIQNEEQPPDTQVHAEPITEKIVYVPVQKIVEVIKVVQVPLLKIVEIPVELKTSQVVEVPVEMQIEPLIYEIPIDVASPVQILQIPLEMQEPPIVIEVPVEMNLIDQERASTPLNKKTVRGQAIDEEVSSPAVHFSLKNREQAQAQKLREEVVVIPMDKNLNEIEIDAKSHSSCSQIVVEIPYQLQSARSVCDAQIQTDEIFREQQPKMIKNSSDQQIYDALTLLECAQKSKEQDPPKVHIIQIPVQLQMDYSDEVRKLLELKYRERISDLHNQYSTQIANLHEMLQNLQRIIIEEQQVAQQLKDQLQHKALQEQKLNSNIIKLQQRVREREETVSGHQQLKKVYNQLQNRYNELLNEPPTLYEMAVQMVVKIDRQTVAVQTDDLTLPSDVSVIEVPVEIQVVQKISDSSLRRSEEDEVKSSSTTNNKYFKGYTEQELHQKLKAMMVRPQLMDRFTQTEKPITIDDLVDFQLRADNQLNITEMFDNTQIINKNYKIYAQNEQSMREEHLISGIQSIEQYENIIDFKIYEYAVEVYPEPVIYEVPVDVKVFKQLSISEVQTDDVYSQIVVQEKIFQVPIELHVKQWTIDAQIQTEREVIVEHSNVFSKKNEIVTTKVYENNMMEKDVDNSRAQLLYASSTRESKLIEIPIELNIQVQKETISIDIQTRQTWNQVDKSGKRQQSKLRITPVLEEKLIAKQQTSEIALGNPYETHNVIRLESACFQIPQHRIQQLASNGDMFNNEMIMLQQSNGNDSRVVVHVQDNNELHFDQIGQLRQAVGKGSEIKQNYIEIYQQNHNVEVQRYKSLYQQLQQENFELKEELEHVQNKYQQEIKRLQLHKLELERNLSNYQTIVQQQSNKFMQLSVLKSKEQQKFQKLEEQYEKLKNYNANIETSSNKEIDRLQAIINDKIEQIKEMKLQQHQTKQMYQAQITALRAKVVERDENIQQLEQQNQKRLTKIQQLIQYQDELRKAVAYAKQNSENNAVALYEQQFQRIKDDFEQKKRQLKLQIISLNEDIQSIKAQLQAETQRNRVLSEQIRQIQNKFDEVKGQYTILRSVKSELESNYVQNLKQFNAQLHQCRELIAQKDKIIHQLQSNSEKTIESPIKLKEANPETHEDQPVRMQYLSRKMSREADDPRFITAYVNKLQKLLLRYQKIMAGNESTIQQLQEKVCEYLRDALQKEQEAENLYAKLVEYQCAMNNILVEKITLQIQNKRMAKAVELSQRKVLILGNKLIEAVGRRHPHDSEDSDYYYQ